LDLNFQKVYTHSQSSGHIHIRTALSYIFQHSKKPAKCKNDSQTAKSHLIPENFSLNLVLSTCQCKNCKKITDTVASMDQNLPIDSVGFLPWQKLFLPGQWKKLVKTGKIKDTIN